MFDALPSRTARLSASELATDMRRREPGDLLDVLEPVALLDQAYRVLQRPAAPGEDMLRTSTGPQ